MSPELPAPPEPTAERLYETIDASRSDIERLYGAETAEEWLVGSMLLPYLWHYWSGPLGRAGTSWTDFQRCAAATGNDCTWIAKRWASGDREWDDVLDAFADAFDGEIR